MASTALCRAPSNQFRSSFDSIFFTPHRYFATLHPLSSANTWLRSHCNLVLMIGWILGSLLASISVQNVQVVDIVYQNETYKDCRHWVGLSDQDIKIYICTTFVLTFVLPMTFLTISYGAIGRRLLRAQQHWCSFKQTAPFSLHTASRTQSSLNSNCSNSVNAAGPRGHVNGKLELNSLSDGQSGSMKSSTFIRCKPSKQSLKQSNVHTVVKVSRTKSNQSVDSMQKSQYRNKSVKMYTSQHSQENLPADSTSKVLIRFDRRNTEFLNKMRVSMPAHDALYIASR